jgi:hypothetical protein
MTESDLRRLRDRALDRALDHLEGDIWTQVDRRASAQRAHGIVLMWQAGAIAMALFGAVALGSAAAKATMAIRGELDAFSPETGLAPSSLLLGRKI